MYKNVYDAVALVGPLLFRILLLLQLFLSHHLRITLLALREGEPIGITLGFVHLLLFLQVFRACKITLIATRHFHQAQIAVKVKRILRTNFD